MNPARLLLLIAIGGYMTTCVAADDSICPAGPFETDLVKISSALASVSADSASTNQSAGSPEAVGNERLTDGFTSWGAGGLGAVPGSGASLNYDAKRYLSISQSTVPGRASEIVRTFDHPIPNSSIVVRQVGPDLTSTTVTARATPAQAREIACFANQLFTSEPEEAVKPSNESPVDSRNSSR